MKRPLDLLRYTGARQPLIDGIGELEVRVV